LKIILTNIETLITLSKKERIMGTDLDRTKSGLHTYATEYVLAFGFALTAVIGYITIIAL